MDWVANHRSLKQLDKKYAEIYVKNIRKYMGPKEIEKSTGNIVFPWHNLLNTLCGLIPQVIASKSEEEKIPNRPLANNLSE